MRSRAVRPVGLPIYVARIPSAPFASRQRKQRFCSTNTKNLRYLRLPRRSLGVGAFPFVRTRFTRHVTFLISHARVFCCEGGDDCFKAQVAAQRVPNRLVYQMRVAQSFWEAASAIVALPIYVFMR